MFDGIIEFFKNIYENCLAILQAFFKWLGDLLTSFGDSILQQIADVCPDLSSYWSEVSNLNEWVPVINSFFPLYEAGIVISLFFAFIAVFITVKLVVKIFIPFVG